MLSAARALPGMDPDYVARIERSVLRRFAWQVRDGYRMRVYVPFGTQWYPYLMRRLAERPANVAFMVGNVVKESLRSRR